MDAVLASYILSVLKWLGTVWGPGQNPCNQQAVRRRQGRRWEEEEMGRRKKMGWRKKMGRRKKIGVRNKMGRRKNMRSMGRRRIGRRKMKRKRVGKKVRKRSTRPVLRAIPARAFST